MAGLKWDYLFSMTNHAAVAKGGVTVVVSAKAVPKVKRIILSGELQRAPMHSTTFTRLIAFSGSGCGSYFSSVTTTSATTYAYRFRSIMTLTLYDSDGNVLETVNHTSIVTSRKDFTQTEFDALIGEAVML